MRVWCLYIVFLENLVHSVLVGGTLESYHGKKKPFYAVSSFWSCNKCILCNYCSCSVEDSCILLVVPDNSLYTQIWMIQSSKMMERFRRCKEVGGTKRVMDEKTSGGIKR